MTLSEKMKAYRKKHGLSRHAFAQLCEINNCTIYYVESETKKPSNYTIDKINHFIDNGHNLTVQPRKWVHKLKEKEQAIALHHAGGYPTDIARQLKVSNPIVYKWLKSEGLTPHVHPKNKYANRIGITPTIKPKTGRFAHLK